MECECVVKSAALVFQLGGWFSILYAWVALGAMGRLGFLALIVSFLGLGGSVLAGAVFQVGCELSAGLTLAMIMLIVLKTASIERGADRYSTLYAADAA